MIGQEGASVSKNRHPIGYPEHLWKFVRDENHPHSLVSEAFHEGQEALGFVGGQDGGGFIENEEASFSNEGPKEGGLLLLAGGQLKHRLMEGQVEFEGLALLIDHGFKLFPVQTTGEAFPAQDDILQRGEALHQSKVLIDHADAQLLSILSRLKDDWGVVHQKGSRGRSQRTSEDVHKGGFAGPVFPDNGVDFPGLDGEVHFTARNHLSKMNRNAARSEGGYGLAHELLVTLCGG